MLNGAAAWLAAAGALWCLLEGVSGEYPPERSQMYQLRTLTQEMQVGAREEATSSAGKLRCAAKCVFSNKCLFFRVRRDTLITKYDPESGLGAIQLKAVGKNLAGRWRKPASRQPVLTRIQTRGAFLTSLDAPCGEPHVTLQYEGSECRMFVVEEDATAVTAIVTGTSLFVSEELFPMESNGRMTTFVSVTGCHA